MLVQSAILLMTFLGGVYAPADAIVSAPQTANLPTSGVTRAEFGKTADGTSVAVYTMTNKKGVTARIMT
ncbi:MAG: hypothetical protein H7145_19895, partial [Akkermansiaceae bacterium]|nr:hypothetical protein [Armatimonadota bacterium]